MRQGSPIDGRPLYAQVRDELTRRVRSGAWRPGMAIPSEHELAAELGVSQGTVRKALDAMARDNILRRQQGRGTFVREQTSEDVLFRYFQLFDDDGERIAPEGDGAALSEGPATREEAARLKLGSKAAVIRLARERLRDGRPFISETIVVPRALFQGLAAISPVPNTLYDLFQQRFGITVMRADERITAVAAPRKVAARLGLPAGTPLLHVDRTAFDLDGRPVEWRVSYCHLVGAHYLSRVG